MTVRMVVVVPVHMLPLLSAVAWALWPQFLKTVAPMRSLVMFPAAGPVSPLINQGAQKLTMSTTMARAV